MTAIDTIKPMHLSRFAMLRLALFIMLNVLNSQWSMVNCQSSIFNRQSSIVNGHLAVIWKHPCLLSYLI